MAGYSRSDKFLHRVYLSNYALANASLEMEEILYGSKASTWKVEQNLFVTGLARSGTTAVMRKLHDSGAYASLQYSNMPFILAPNLWKRKTKIKSHERAHQDGILVDGDSPEEFDEYFWKVQLRDSYINDKDLTTHSVNPAILEKYERYIRLICYAKGRHRYISKNNNNILRISSLKNLYNSHIVMLFRNPVDHASSLRKLHLNFIEIQKEDPFILAYFDYLGHHEFGLHHKPFGFNNNPEKTPNDHSLESLNYWLTIWLNYYSYVLATYKNDIHFICFESLIAHPNKVFGKLWNTLEIETTYKNEEKHQPRDYKEEHCDTQLLKKCELVYDQLKSLT